MNVWFDFQDNTHCMQMLIQLKVLSINASWSSGVGAIERPCVLSSDVCVPRWVAQNAQTCPDWEPGPVTSEQLWAKQSERQRGTDWLKETSTSISLEQFERFSFNFFFCYLCAGSGCCCRVFCLEEGWQNNSKTRKQSKREITIIFIWIFDDSLCLKS